MEKNHRCFPRTVVIDSDIDFICVLFVEIMTAIIPLHFDYQKMS
jgi:hypothetical protein